MLCYVVLLVSFLSVCESSEFCSVNPGEVNNDCLEASKITARPRFLFYDVNPPEGFNLRRDVYMRLAVMIRKLSEKADWHLVLPPWPKLYHWRSRVSQERLPWSLFFDLESLQAFAPVMDLQQYITEYGVSSIEQVYILQHFKDDWAAGRFEEKQSIEVCNETPPYVLEEDGRFSGYFWGFKNLTASNMACLSFHGRAFQLAKYLSGSQIRTVMVDHAEVVLHESYGDKEYWQARRSMRFSKKLVEKAVKFRQQVLNSSDEADKTVRPEDWRKEKGGRTALGGPYLCVHMRRRDFLWGRPKEVPSLPSVAQQLRYHLSKLQLNVVFIATDAPDKEFQEIQSALSDYTIVKYIASEDELLEIKDGGVAIVEQIICSHARFFIGTYESTFSFRIQEEREIMGFKPDTTFNSLCGDGSNGSCKQPSRWLAVF
ncbi:GDP-fucose protein O-fucosyltransferase 2 [Gryllus bimaculatus]|nr:GDP-fucose protein O-fucosyltransferase 2 [Gryllus bimaculatus]